MLIFAISIIAFAVFIEIVSFLLYQSRSFEGLKKAYQAILYRKQKTRDDIRTFSLRYSEHPFLALTSDPDFMNSYGEKIHNKYGFRHKGDFEDIDRQNELVVYCAGGSSTYCNFIEKNEDTWPGVMETSLNGVMLGKKAKVINAACSGWTSFQSLIRFTAWVDVLRPDLVIIYHGKNDLAPFANSELSIDNVHPDYGNVMHSLHFDSVAKGLPFLAKYTFTGKILYGAYVNRRYFNVLWHIYKQKGPTSKENSIKGLERIGPGAWDFIISRYKSFASLCKDRKIPVLFVLQKVVSDILDPYVGELNRRVSLLEDRSNNIFVYDFAGELKDTKDVLYDAVHFTENGAKVCADMVKDYIIKNIPAFRESADTKRAGCNKESVFYK